MAGKNIGTFIIFKPAVRAWFLCFVTHLPFVNSAVANEHNNTPQLALVTSHASEQQQNLKQEFPAATHAPSSLAYRQLEKIFTPDLSKKRRIYRQAQADIQKNGLKEHAAYRKYRKALKDYPLWSYLEYLRLDRNIQETSMSRIEATFPLPQDAHFAITLRKRRLELLANRGRWQDFLDYYDTVPSSAALECQYALAHYRSGKQDIALDLTRQLWLTPKSMPSECDIPFHLFQRSGAIDSALTWQRYVPAFTQGNHRLARYLKRFLQGEQKQLAEQLELWYSEPLRINQDWQKIVSAARLLHSADQEYLKDIQLLLIKRLVRTNQKAALELILHRLDKPESTGLSELQHQALNDEAKAYIVQRHALTDYNKLPALYKQLGEHNVDSSWEWLLRSHIARAEWQRVYETLQQAPDSITQQERWQYWSLRSKQLTGKLSDSDQQALLSFTQNPNFYGFAASHALLRDYSVPQASYQRSAEALNKVLTNTHILRAVEHFAHAELVPARRDWNRALRRFDKSETIEAAYLASELGWHSQAINTAAQAQAWRHYSIRFPDIYRDQFRHQAFRYQQSPQWFYATARQESALSETAQSSAGAVGLMQILPTTARQVARSLQTGYDRSSLQSADYSITLGTAYLDQLYHRYQNRALSSAAYNAGPQRVDRWLRNLDKEIPLDAWIETIRFAETRQYVQNVMSFGLIHFTLHDQSTNNALWPDFAFFPPEESQVKPFSKQVK